MTFNDKDYTNVCLHKYMRNNTSQTPTDIEKDKFVFNGLKAQIQTIDNYIKTTQGYIDKLSENADTKTDPKRKENIDLLILS